MQESKETEVRSRQGRFTVEITDFALKGLKKIARRNSGIRDEVDRIMKRISRDPEIGQELTSDLFGMRAMKSADGKYRIVYKLESARHGVVVHAVGGRNRVYDDLARMLNRVMPYTGNRFFGRRQGKK